ncbi:MAG: ADP-ribosylglycohydrolase family protein [Bacilli bacterium]
MYGAILGDIIGSAYEYEEFNSKKIDLEKRFKILNKDTPLFLNNSRITDDSILTIAIADAIFSKVSYEEKLREHGLKYLKKENNDPNFFDKPFSPGFIKWLKKEKEANSTGNGAAMRVSSVGFLFNSEEEVLREARLATIPSHNTEEAIRGARAVALSIYLARNGFSKKKIKEYIENNFKYNLDLSLDILQRTNTFKMNCDTTVPQAVFLFLISNNFEDAIRKAVSIGGDTDTIACITGSIAEAYYGIDNDLKNKIFDYIDKNQSNIIKKYDKRLAVNTSF